MCFVLVSYLFESTCEGFSFKNGYQLPLSSPSIILHHHRHHIQDHICPRWARRCRTCASWSLGFGLGEKDLKGPIGMRSDQGKHGSLEAWDFFKSTSH